MNWGYGGNAPTAGVPPLHPFKNPIGLLYESSKLLLEMRTVKKINAYMIKLDDEFEDFDELETFCLCTL
jgi:hypothetical protein